MSQPLYFLPGITAATLNGQAVNTSQSPLNEAVLRERGIADVFADVRAGEYGLANINKGPGERSGALLYYQRPDGKIPAITQYAPHAQTWMQAGDNLFIGIANDDKPTPADLARRKQIKGMPLDLGYGDFLVPTIRRIDGSSQMPRSLAWDSGGNVIQPIKPEYMERWERAGVVADWMLCKTWEDQFLPQALEHAVDALGLNYRFGRHEQNLLRVVDVENLFTILGAVCDYYTSLELQDAQKKTSVPASIASITHGQPDALAATNPLTENSTL